MVIFFFFCLDTFQKPQNTKGLKSCNVWFDKKKKKILRKAACVENLVPRMLQKSTLALCGSSGLHAEHQNTPESGS